VPTTLDTGPYKEFLWQTVSIFADIAPGPGDLVVLKHCYSGFQGTELEFVLRSLDVSTVVIAGTPLSTFAYRRGRRREPVSGGRGGRAGGQRGDGGERAGGSDGRPGGWQWPQRRIWWRRWQPCSSPQR
jgi:hypothetical protein